MRTPWYRVTVVLSALLAAGLAPNLSGAPVAAAPAGAPAFTLPAGVTAGYAVYDRQTGTFAAQSNETAQFRSASVVKLLIALDFLWNRGPDYAVPAADRDRLNLMLRSSDDSAASYYYGQGGYEAIINRMVPRLGLRNTIPPPADQRGFWGYTGISAADTVRVYRYLLEAAPPPVHDFILDDLHSSTRCGTDGYNQYFGIPMVFARPFALKQGWSGFSSTPVDPCVAAPGDPTAPTAPTAPKAPAAVSSVSSAPAAVPGAVVLTGQALHTTGVVGAGDRTIVAVFSLYPSGTSFSSAYRTLTELTRSLPVPGATKLPGAWFGTWGSGVRVHTGASTSSAVITSVPDGATILVQCQVRGQSVTVPPYTNDWWAYLPQYGGYMTNIYFTSPDNQLPGVPTC